jgi:hypothetical protein
MDPEIIDFVEIFVQWIIRGLEFEFGIFKFSQKPSFNRLRALKLEKLHNELDAHIDPNFGPIALISRVMFFLI